MRVLALVTLFGVLGLQGVSHADGAAPAEFLLTLRNGGIYRGEVLEYEPGDHVTLRLARGDIKHFPWKDVASATAVQAGKATPTAAAPAPAPARVQPPPAPPPPRASVISTPPAPKPPTQQEVFDRHVKAAEVLYQSQEPARALRELQLAYQISPRPSLLYLMARSYQQLRRYDDAINLYRRYMQADDNLEPEKRARIGALVASLQEMSVPAVSEVTQRRDSDEAADDTAPAATPKYQRRTGLMVSGIVVLASSYSAAAIFGSLGLAGASTLSTQQYSRSAIDQAKAAFGTLYIPVIGPFFSAVLVRKASYSVPWVLVGLGTQVAGLAMTIAGAQKRPTKQYDAVSVVPMFGGTNAGLAVLGSF